jgi:hypothetical protein
MTADQLRALAKSGAELTLNRLRQEIIAIERTFPELAQPQGRRGVKAAPRRTRRMSGAARKAASLRMKKYWAKRRKMQKQQKPKKGK